MIKNCKCCGKEFNAIGKARYCSKDCFKLIRQEQQREEYERNKVTHIKSMKNYYEKHKEEARQNSKKMSRLYPEKKKARGVIASMVRDGFKYPEHCEDCGAGGVIHAHHPDYSKPKEVQFLCVACHNDRHRIYKIK